MKIQGEYRLKSKKYNFDVTLRVQGRYKEGILDDIEQMTIEYLLDSFDVKEYEDMRELIPDEISQIKFTTLTK